MPEAKRELTEEEVDDVCSKIEWEGLETYLEEYAFPDFEGTDLEEPLFRYIEAKNELISAMSDYGIDV